MEPPINSKSDISRNFSFPLESSYNNASGTGGEKYIHDTDGFDRCELPFPFSHLQVKRTRGSSGKCWVFHKSVDGNFKGYIFPGGFRIMGIDQRTACSGESFLENRNFLCSRYGLLGAVIPKKASVCCVIETDLILISKLYEDQKKGN